MKMKKQGLVPIQEENEKKNKKEEKLIINPEMQSISNQNADK